MSGVAWVLEFGGSVAVGTAAVVAVVGVVFVVAVFVVAVSVGVRRFDFARMR